MDSYEQLLAARKQTAAAEETAFIQHFGREAEDCDNWQRLWENGWWEELRNPTPTADYQPRKLPRDEEGAPIGGWIDEQDKAHSYGPGLYSQHFLYVLTKGIADGGPALISKLSYILQQADGIDCDQLTHVVDTISTFLSSHTLRYLSGRGATHPVGTPAEPHLFFQSWNEQRDSKGVIIYQLGIAVPGRPIIPHDVAINTLGAVRRQIEAKRALLATQVSPQIAPQTQDLSSSHDDPPERDISNLFNGLTMAECYNLAVKVGFIDSKKQPKGPAGPSKIWGMVETLVWYQFADTGKTGEMVQLIAKLYSVKIKNNYTPDATTEARRKSRRTTSSWLLTQKKVTEELHDKFVPLCRGGRLPNPEHV